MIYLATSVVLQPTEEIFASYSFLVEMNVGYVDEMIDIQVIRSALRSYTVLTNNSRILLTVDGQKFPVIVRLLNPEERSRMNSGVEVVVAKNIYVSI